MRKFRKKPILVEAEQNADGTWFVHGAQVTECITDQDFRLMYDEVSPLYRVQPLRLDIAEGSD